jgi:hypothetical protein
MKRLTQTHRSALFAGCNDASAAPRVADRAVLAAAGSRLRPHRRSELHPRHPLPMLAWQVFRRFRGLGSAFGERRFAQLTPRIQFDVSAPKTNKFQHSAIRALASSRRCARIKPLFDLNPPAAMPDHDRGGAVTMSTGFTTPRRRSTPTESAFAQVRLSASSERDFTVETLRLLSKSEMADRRLNVLWNGHFVDRPGRPVPRTGR